MSKNRQHHVIGVSLLLFGAGILYGIFVKYTRIGIPCMFHVITGWKCPGCGITRMFVALLQMDIKAAYMANPAVLLLSPVLAAVFITYLAGYMKTGLWKMGRVQYGALWFCIVILILYGIGRNVLLIL